MLRVLWRLVLMALLLPFVVFPVLNLIALPIEIYLVVSMAAIVWRRHAQRGATE